MTAELYKLYYSEILHFTASLSGSFHNAEDITQETFVRALVSIETLGELSQPQCRVWLYKTAKNIFIDRIRQYKKEQAAEGEESTAEDDLSEVMVAELLSELPELERTLFRLRYFEGYNATELSEMFGLPSSTVRYKLAEARKKLKKMLGT